MQGSDPYAIFISDLENVIPRHRVELRGSRGDQSDFASLSDSSHTSLIFGITWSSSEPKVTIYIRRQSPC